ncbi:hypothetical protein JZ751_024361 [Albula glossodonta]|uniref:Uncharacterized protein n=1 Tax=Albula glossodonta TaxID=121402 RepID=A0A8T2NRK0_9TELE|nr:hypothetical protein JZ751_028374 [Albula glossodonta]KAG9338967.1 hypothetical protein JZ751_024361 [Albula glossodonta]
MFFHAAAPLLQSDGATPDAARHCLPSHNNDVNLLRATVRIFRARTGGEVTAGRQKPHLHQQWPFLMSRMTERECCETGI